MQWPAPGFMLKPHSCLPQHNSKTRSIQKRNATSTSPKGFVKILPCQGQNLARLRMLMALMQTNSFKANSQILTRVDTVQKFGLFGSAKVSAGHTAFDPPTSANSLHYCNIHTIVPGQFSSQAQNQIIFVLLKQSCVKMSYSFVFKRTNTFSVLAYLIQYHLLFS